MPRMTIKELARLADVSVGTASMALNDNPKVNEETKKKVQQIAREHNYTPNDTARSLITKKSKCIGLIVTDIRNPFFAMLVDEFNREADALGYTLLLGISNDSIAKERKHIEAFLGKNVEGVVIVPAAQRQINLDHIYTLRIEEVPFVFCTSIYHGILESCVMTDLQTGEFRLIEHLLAKGHRKIVLLTGDKDLLLSKLRIEGYRRAFAQAKQPFEESWIVETVPDFEHGYDTTMRIAAEKPDAIATINDFLAMGVLKALKDLSIRVPGDISVAGYDDLLISSLLETPLTTVRQPIHDLCNKTLEVLLKKMEGAAPERETIYLEPQLKIRTSTR